MLGMGRSGGVVGGVNACVPIQKIVLGRRQERVQHLANQTCTGSALAGPVTPVRPFVRPSRPPAGFHRRCSTIGLVTVYSSSSPFARRTAFSGPRG